MLKHEILKILPELLDKIEFESLKIQTAIEPVYGDIDPKTEDVIEETLRDEYDIVLEDDEFSHKELMVINEILEPYPHIQMWIRKGELGIHSTDIAPEDKKKRKPSNQP